MSEAPVVQMGFFDLILQADWVVKFVLLSLLAGSVFVWAIILSKRKRLRAAKSQNAKFIEMFWQGKSMDDIFTKSDEYPNSPTCALFKSGFKELKKLSISEKTALVGGEMENIERALARASHAQVDSMERNIGWLATAANASPFVGLFGTVWGIMNSFQGIGATGSANLAVVAPGIAEALIATAAGLATAIPAVIAYNHFVNEIKRVVVDMDCFSQDFLNIIQRSLMGGRRKS